MASPVEFSEQGTSKTVKAGGMDVHYHDVGSGDPIVLLHSYGPGTTGWITFHKILPALAQRYRRIVMDLPNFGRTGPVTYNEPLHNLQARTALALMDKLGIEKAHLVGNSQGGQSAMVVAIFARSLGFTWLALLIVIAELLIVILRFIYSYEQTFLGDLVRFWYAGLFLFASAYTLIQEGHVRVDILFTSFSVRGKAWSNVIGTMLFGIPVCWIILTRGLWTKTSSINAPLLSFEVTQSGFGMYVKYLMAGFLLVYALSMLIQFCGYFLGNAGVLLKDGDAPAAGPSGQHSQ